MKTITAKHLDTLVANKKPFQFGEYMSQGLNMYKKNFGEVFLGSLVATLISGIPIIGWVVSCNIYRMLNKIQKKQPNALSELFNFDRVKEVCLFYLLLFLVSLVVILPIYLTFILGIIGTQEADLSPAIMGITSAIAGIFLLVFIAFLTSFSFFALPMLSLSEFDLNQIFGYSWRLTKKYWIVAFFFSFVVGLMATLVGLVLCGIGIYLTIGYIYTCHYTAYQDLLFDEEEAIDNEINQIEGYTN